ncbi:hypothetical protein [Endozoicomonas euniceicola]|uniref:Transposase n=1 Tax=Endozoicomonas euniceicola TaxID=1234143 RepID=A0ABY6H0L5_9GAMM|nr:hypothetical protein [Endozoicomonas euniceicola]UYM18588.1 hypothetical protein NX720_12030 [Endozoicomonas euniceicola]
MSRRDKYIYYSVSNEEKKYAIERQLEYQYATFSEYIRACLFNEKFKYCRNDQPQKITKRAEYKVLVSQSELDQINEESKNMNIRKSALVRHRIIKKNIPKPTEKTKTDQLDLLFNRLYGMAKLHYLSLNKYEKLTKSIIDELKSVNQRRKLIMSKYDELNNVMKQLISKINNEQDTFSELIYITKIIGDKQNGDNIPR